MNDWEYWYDINYGRHHDVVSSDEPISIGECEACGETLYKGEYYIRIDGDLLCESSCIEKWALKNFEVKEFNSGERLK